MKNTSLLLALLACGTLTACAGAFDDSSSSQSDAVQINGTVHVATQALESGDPPIIRQETQAEPASAGTALHEPNNGWWYNDQQDPEDQVYYDSCSGSENAIEITQVARRTTVDTVAKTFTVTNVLTDSILMERVGLPSPDGDPYQPGDELSSFTCDYVSSFANCSNEEPRLLADFVDYGYDAVIYENTDFYMYFDYGQQRYRELIQTQLWCEGADCAAPFPASIVPNGRCSINSMNVWRRAAPPTFIYRDYSAN